MARRWQETRVALCLFGISYLRGYPHWAARSVDIDYEWSLENYREKLMAHLPSVDVFVSTYAHEKLDALQKDWNVQSMVVCDEPARSGLIPDVERQKNEVLLRFASILPPTYDVYLFTRFDLRFRVDLGQFDMVEDKIHVFSTLEAPQLICDNFYLVPKEKLSHFFEALRNHASSSRHRIEIFGGRDHIHLLRDQPGSYIGDLSAYKIVRGKK